MHATCQFLTAYIVFTTQSPTSVAVIFSISHLW